LREVFPHVRIDLSAKAVEFDATTSPLLVEDPRAPLMFLEAIACTPDTREHEALVVSKAKPSHIHAAMLLVGLVPGEPGGWRMEGEALEPVDPKGPRVKIELAWRDADGTARAVDPLAWVVSARGGVGIDAATRAAARLDGRPGPWWVFAGSRMTRVPDADGRPREVYDADESGVVIGLATFGAELVAFARTFSPDASVAEPEWVVDFSPGPPIAPVPPPGTAVLVRITAQ
jgi:hypothetical protein